MRPRLGTVSIRHPFASTGTEVEGRSGASTGSKADKRQWNAYEIENEVPNIMFDLSPWLRQAAGQHGVGRTKIVGQLRSTDKVKE